MSPALPQIDGLRPETLDAVIDSPTIAPDAPAPLAPGAESLVAGRETFPREGCGALVLGGAHGALGVVRSLGRHGIPAWFVTDDNMLAKFSRHAQAGLRWPGPNDAGAADWLLELARRHRLDGWVLMPCADEEARLVSQHHEDLAAVFRVTTPPWDVMRWAYDKRRMNERAAFLGLDVPRSFCPGGRQDLARLDLRFPAILKPAVKQHGNAFTLAKAWRVDDRDALLARYDQALALVSEDAIVVQELIPGRGDAQFSYAAVWQRGRPIGSLVARRARQYPIDFGYTSTFVETIERQEVEALACRFLTSLDYDGMVEVEFKYDARDRRYKLLDVNARAWTWISLGRKAGVDFPHLLWRLALGETVPPARGRPGAAWMHASRDVVAACQEMAAGHLSPKDYLASLRAPIEFAAFAADDPLPGMLDLPLVLARFLRRRLPDSLRRMTGGGQSH
ncbi:MAG TPA: ATP-grasp domain-containing protein [Xanthobacteraceae bacterium]|nr:ATP-grasp domain-containing protein [Xanthobacteraceae bacterium]